MKISAPHNVIQCINRACTVAKSEAIQFAELTYIKRAICSGNYEEQLSQFYIHDIENIWNVHKWCKNLSLLCSQYEHRFSTST